MNWRKEIQPLEWVFIIQSNKSLRQNRRMNQNSVWCKWKSVYLKNVWTIKIYFRILALVRRVKSSIWAKCKENKKKDNKEEWKILLWHLGWIKGIQDLLISSKSTKQTQVVMALLSLCQAKKMTISMSWWGVQLKISRSLNTVKIKRSRGHYR